MSSLQGVQKSVNKNEGKGRAAMLCGGTEEKKGGREDEVELLCGSNEDRE